MLFVDPDHEPVNTGPVDVVRQGGEASHSIGLIKPERFAAYQSPITMAHRGYNTHCPGPHDYNFSCVKTSKFFEAPDGRTDLRGRT